MEKDGLLIRLGKEVLLQKLKKNLYDIVNSDNQRYETNSKHKIQRRFGDG